VISCRLLSAEPSAPPRPPLSLLGPSPGRPGLRTLWGLRGLLARGGVLRPAHQLYVPFLARLSGALRYIAIRYIAIGA
jgi:hypothetical protein